MTSKRFKVTNISSNGMTGLFWLGKDNLSVYDIIRLLNDLMEENERLNSEYKILHTQYRDLKRFMENNFDEHLTQEKLNRQIIKLFEENEQLKKDIEYYKTERLALFEYLEKKDNLELELKVKK